MKKLLIFILALVAAIPATNAYNLLPAPVSVEDAAGTFALPAGQLTISGKNAAVFARDLKRRGIEAKTSGKGIVILSVDSSLGEEAYRITVKSSGISVEASAPAGFYYAAQTLAQMVSQADGERQMACVTIEDSPRFGYRGMMLDLVRCYQPFEHVKKLVDQASALKINNVHLHLTDDNGWRLEIKKYPKLTEVGAWRVDRPELFPGRLNARSADEPATYGGFYTQKQMRELVKYAAERHVNIIPEIEMPAHAAGAIASYPELACPVDEKFVGVFPGIGGRDASIIICGGSDFALQFYRDVLDEVIDIFPSKMIHLGGDEAEKSHWARCPRCKARIEAEGLAGLEELQGWFMDRISEHVISKGRIPMGWDEATYGNPMKDMVIMGWQGMGQVAVNDARKTGRKFIMTPARKLYLIRYQGPQWFEPFTYFGNVTLSDVYNFDPVGDDWTPELENQLLGMQGSLWCEFCRTTEDVDYMLFPRMLAVAERAWAPKGRSDWAGFLRSVDAFLPSLEKAGIDYARSMYNIQHTVRPSSGGKALDVMLECERPELEIRTSSSSGFESAVKSDGKIVVDGSQTVYAATFDPVSGKMLGQPLVLKFDFNKATAGKVVAKGCTNNLEAVLTNGLRGSDRNSDFEWAGWHDSNVEFTVDMGEIKPVDEVRVGALVNSDVCVAAPKTLYLYVSPDGRSYTLVKTLETAPELVFHKGAKVIDYVFDGLAADARYLRLVAVNPGCIPDGMAREGVPTWVYFDEVTVK